MLTPLGSRILIEVEAQAAVEETKSGILLPASVPKEKPLEGKVLAVGKDVKEVHVGDQVIYGKFAGAEVKVDGLAYMLLHEDDILGIL